MGKLIQVDFKKYDMKVVGRYRPINKNPGTLYLADDRRLYYDHTDGDVDKSDLFGVLNEDDLFNLLKNEYLPYESLAANIKIPETKRSNIGVETVFENDVYIGVDIINNKLDPTANLAYYPMTIFYKDDEPNEVYISYLNLNNDNIVLSIDDVRLICYDEVVTNHLKDILIKLKKEENMGEQ